MKLKTVEIDLGDNSYKINIGNKPYENGLFGTRQ